MMSNMIKSKSHVAGSMGSKVRDKSGSVKVSGQEKYKGLTPKKQNTEHINIQDD